MGARLGGEAFREEAARRERPDSARSVTEALRRAGTSCGSSSGIDRRRAR